MGVALKRSCDWAFRALGVQLREWGLFGKRFRAVRDRPVWEECREKQLACSVTRQDRVPPGLQGKLSQQPGMRAGCGRRYGEAGELREN